MAKRTSLNTYSTIEDIQARKQQLRNSLQRDNGEISQLWNGLFAKPEVSTPTNRIQSFMSKGLGVVDGAILGWKLYQKFSKGKKKKKQGLLKKLFL